ncbi:hypothetical protein AB0B45_13860 [Nonomuraea sp. NPDC049152]|uniref:hypothetical protein n=1 Tax=Nonomuraea sp. NPDC049152 TaxID=3154350 RepID=UPI003409FEEE
MSDPRSIAPATEFTRPPERRRAHRALRAIPWTALVLAAAGNMTASLTGMSTLVRLAFGLTALLCIIVLVADHLRGRRR